MRTRLRFSIRALLGSVALLAISLGGWIAYSNYQLKELTELREQGAIVIIRDRTPEALRTIGIKHLSPFYSVPTVELYVTPRGMDALVGNSDKPISKAEAQDYILRKAAVARSYGATDIQLITLDSFDPEWVQFALENSMSSIGEKRKRYLARLEANQKSGANINP